MLTRVCAWCGTELGTKSSEGEPSAVSHGICPTCRSRVEAEGVQRRRKARLSCPQCGHGIRSLSLAVVCTAGCGWEQWGRL